jgi:hypothetical protein
MTNYLINGSTASLSPFSVRWVPQIAITDHNRQPVYHGYNVEMRFPACCPADAAQWIDAVSSGSVDLQIINRWNLTFTNLSAVYCTIAETPASEDVHVEPFVIIVHGVYV